MEHYVTLFDSLFLPQGLALHASLGRHAGAHTLWILCVDADTFDVLASLKLRNVRLIRLVDVQTPELARVKPSRSVGEYCWTLTPFAPKFVFDADPTVERVTYLDADLFLFRSPGPIFEEFEQSRKGVLITRHAFAPENDQSDTAGHYCVQFITFVRSRGEVVRLWWAERCIEWCHARLEDGKFGDQKYLDDWTERFGDAVHVLKQVELMQAPWNMTRFAPSEAVAFHFHGLRLLRDGHALLCDGYRMHCSTKAMLYQPYLKELARSIEVLKAEGFVVRPQASASIHWLRIRTFARQLLHFRRQLPARRIVKLPS